MEKEKIEAIKKISSEVSEFHPVLRVLFNRLPNISNVEYTQGPTEMGADFVLTKKDETLNDIEYIGVIVKVGQIKQDHSEIERQIEECEIERTVEGGVRKVFLSEVWVISNDNITNGAKEKIHHKYKNKNIKFIPGEKVTSLIDTYYPDYWRNISVEIGEYFSKLKQYCENIIINKSIFDGANKDIYVEQDLIIFERQKDYEKANFKKNKKTNIFSVLDKESYILIEATMGVGKSTLLAQVAKKYSDNEFFKKSKTIPIIVTAKKLFSDYKSDISLLINKTVLENKLSDFDNVLVLIDGLDEIDVGSKDILNELNNIYLTSKDIKNVKVIVSSRNIEDPDVEAGLQKSYVRYRLCQLTIKQVINLVGKICNSAEIQRKLEKDLDKSHLFKVLPKTPISAILLAKLLNENIQEIPSTMTELYGKYMELVLGRWDMNKGLQSQIEYDVKNNVTINVASFLMENSFDEISEGDFRAIYDDYTGSRNIPNIDKDELFNQLKKNKEVFSISPLKKMIRFRHRTFAEFFTAQGINRDNKAHIDENIFGLYWNTTYFFYLGIKRDSENLIKAINEIKFSDPSTRMLKIFCNGGFLLAAHLTPYKYIKEAVKVSFRDAADFYYEIMDSKGENPLRCLSKVHLLCLFTRTLCDSYEYEFFSPALEDLAMEIYTSPKTNNIDLLKLFFINSVLISISKSKSYDHMIESYGKEIPLELQIGIKCHAGDYDVSSAIVKKFIKKFDKNIKTNIGFKSAVLEMAMPSKVKHEKITKS